MKKVIVLMAMFWFAVSATVLAEEGKGNGFRQGQREKVKTHRQQQKSENQAFRQTLKDMKPEERQSAMKARREEQYKEKALQWLEQTTAEKNSITNAYTQLGIQNSNAFDSQALIQLKNEYCNRKRCLECAVGNSLLKNYSQV